MAFEIPPVTAFVLLSGADAGLLDGERIAAQLAADWSLDTGVSPVQAALPSDRPEPATAVAAAALTVADCAVDLFLMQGRLAEPDGLSELALEGSGWYADEPFDGEHVAYLEVRIAEGDGERSRPVLGTLLTQVVASLLALEERAVAVHYMPSFTIVDPPSFREVATGFLPDRSPYPIWLQLRMLEAELPDGEPITSGFTLGLAWLGFAELELEPLPAPGDYGAAVLRAAAASVIGGDLELRDGAEFGGDQKFRLTRSDEPRYSNAEVVYAVTPVFED
ncbi:hypothetical protein [Parenemella sanctibonifatiensis]|uniref:DUF4261 domain-containing protein n=1 Tax=Parenemella sanctibonifatiensis TaxID=2016505 RepID=A0A255ELA2_9ACTN|nr:hypothetical protein [Parenemella sanctibonifatiensis]OYN92307.1 hypothetical protein CGZ91_02025 [Parenemella sanctibonifatiensis]